jgi:hypothetical protein
MTEEIDRLGKIYTPDVLLRAAFMKMADFVLKATLDAGPPESFAEAYNLPPDQAKTLYDAVLTAAITRRITNG